MDDLAIYHSEFKLNVTRNVTSSSPPSSPATTATDQTSVIEDSLKHTFPQQQAEQLEAVQGGSDSLVEVIGMSEKRIHNTRKRGRAQNEEVQQISSENIPPKKRKVQSDIQLPERAETANLDRAQTLSSSISNEPSTDLTSDDLDRSTAHVSDKTVATVPLRSSPPLPDRSTNVNIQSNNNLVDDENTKKTSIIGFDKNGPRNQGRSSANKSSSVSSRAKNAKVSTKQNTSSADQVKAGAKPSVMKSPVRTTSADLSNAALSSRGNIADTNEDALAGFLDQSDGATSTSARAEVSTAITKIPSVFVSAATMTSPSPAGLPSVKAISAMQHQTHSKKGVTTSDNVQVDNADNPRPVPSIDLGAHTDQVMHDDFLTAPPLNSSVAIEQSKVSDGMLQKKHTKTKSTAACQRAPTKQNEGATVKTHTAVVPIKVQKLVGQPETSRQQPQQVSSTSETDSSAVNIQADKTLRQAFAKTQDQTAKEQQAVNTHEREELAPHHRDLLDRFVEVAEHLVSKLARNENAIRSLIDECWHRGQLQTD